MAIPPAHFKTYNVQMPHSQDSSSNVRINQKNELLSKYHLAKSQLSILSQLTVNKISNMINILKCQPMLSSPIDNQLMLMIIQTDQSIAQVAEIGLVCNALYNALMHASDRTIGPSTGKSSDRTESAEGAAVSTSTGASIKKGMIESSTRKSSDRADSMRNAEVSTLMDVNEVMGLLDDSSKSASISTSAVASIKRTDTTGQTDAIILQSISPAMKKTGQKRKHTRSLLLRPNGISSDSVQQNLIETRPEKIIPVRETGKRERLNPVAVSRDSQYQKQGHLVIRSKNSSNKGNGLHSLDSDSTVSK